MKDSWPKPKVPKWMKSYLQYEKETMGKRMEMSAISPLQMEMLRAQRAKRRELNEIQRKINRAQSKRMEENRQFFEGQKWFEDKMVANIREERRMTEIRIGKSYTSCDFPSEISKGSTCNQKSMYWTTDCGEVILSACEKHGKPLLEALKFTKHLRKNSLTITGGYDEPEPKSKLVATRDCISQATPFAGKYALEAILEHLIEKEQSDDSS